MTTEKSRLTADVAHDIGAEIVSADTLQTRPELNLPTAFRISDDRR
jgi:tRNA A37 N6-isopentenylltransferase MiaA